MQSLLGKGGDDDGDVNDGSQKRHFQFWYTIFKTFSYGDDGLDGDVVYDDADYCDDDGNSDVNDD